MSRMMWAVHRSERDWFPVMFRPNCDRTLPSERFPDGGESLKDVTERLDKAGYDLRSEPPVAKRENKYE